MNYWEKQKIPPSGDGSTMYRWFERFIIETDHEPYYSGVLDFGERILSGQHTWVYDLQLKKYRITSRAKILELPEVRCELYTEDLEKGRSVLVDLGNYFYLDQLHTALQLALRNTAGLPDDHTARLAEFKVVFRV